MGTHGLHHHCRPDVMKTLVLVCVALLGCSSAAKLDGLLGHNGHHAHHGASAHHGAAVGGNLHLNVNTDSHSHQARKLASSSNEAAVTGSYSWTAPNGETFSVAYVSDEGGFRPVITKGGSAGASFGGSSDGPASRFDGLIRNTGPHRLSSASSVNHGAASFGAIPLGSTSGFSSSHGNTGPSLSSGSLPSSEFATTSSSNQGRSPFGTSSGSSTSFG